MGVAAGVGGKKGALSPPAALLLGRRTRRSAPPRARRLAEDKLPVVLMALRRASLGRTCRYAHTTTRTRRTCTHTLI